MQALTELTPPTAVTHSICLPFLSAAANNLIVIKSSLLQIFSLKVVISNVKQDQGAKSNDIVASTVTPRGERVQTTKLVLIAQYELAGTVTSLARVKIVKSKSGGEALLFALRDAKLSLVEWDPDRYSISTISIHYYEQDNHSTTPWDSGLSQNPTILSVDPNSRCAIFKFGGRQLAILPFRQLGDDVAMDGYGPELENGKQESNHANGIGTENAEARSQTPYGPSVVLSLLALDPSLTHPIHLTFLHEYREPTFGVLSAQCAVTSGLLHERRDNVSYTVYNLDLEQKASTTLLTVNNLPYDLNSIIPLSRIIGGALLVGSNEIIHVDQSGKATGIALNVAAKMCSSFALADQSSLQLKLEGCQVRQLSSDLPDVLIIISNGDLYNLSFNIDGRSVSGLHIRRNSLMESPLSGHVSCMSTFARGRLMFLGGTDSDAVLLGWSRPADGSNRLHRTSIQQEDPEDGDFDDMIDANDEDDLYADDDLRPVAASDRDATTIDGVYREYSFRVHDSLPNVGPLKDLTFANYAASTNTEAAVMPEVELMGLSGCGRSGALTSFQSNIVTQNAIQHNVPRVTDIWSITAKAGEEVGLETAFDTYVFANCIRGQDRILPKVFAIHEESLVEVKSSEFDPDAGPSIEVGTLAGGTRIVQVLTNEVRTWESNLSLAQILPLAEDESESTAVVVSARFAESYLLLIKDDFSAVMLNMDESLDLDVVAQPEVFQAHKWSSGCLYEDVNDVLRLDFGDENDDDEQEASNVLAFMLSASGGLYIYRLPLLEKPVYVAEGLGYLPPFLSTDFAVRRSSAAEVLDEILVAELGDSISKSPYMILRTSENDTIIYQPYQALVGEGRDSVLRFAKISTTNQAPKTLIDGSAVLGYSRPSMRALSSLSALSSVWVPGTPSAFIVKSATSAPHLVNLAIDQIESLTPFHSKSCEQGFAYATENGSMYTARLAAGYSYETGLGVRRIPLRFEGNAIAYHEPSQMYAISAVSQQDFQYPDDELANKVSTAVDEDTFLPKVDRSSIQLFDRGTCTVVHTYELDLAEVVLCMDSVSLEISETSHERQDLICVGTAIIRGEDLPSLGRVYIFSISHVVPDPERQGTGRALKLISKEEVKGAVTALSAVGTQGFLLHTQGQKCMVRGLKEDGSFLPVAFMDMQCYVSAAKELPGTGLCLMGDALKGIWFSGYAEDPYQLRLFSKSPYHIEVIEAAFLPDAQDLHIVAIDGDSSIHILQYDPENPKTLSGHNLLTFPAFYTPHFPSKLTLIPPPFPNAGSLLLASVDGSLSIIKSLPASTHRVLSLLQNHLLNSLPQPLGLSAKAFRSPSGHAGKVADQQGLGLGIGSGRSMIDMSVVRRWEEMGTWRRWGGEEKEEVRRCISLATG